MKQYLLKFNTAYETAIPKFEDSQFFVKLSNMVIKGTESDPERAILLTESEVIRLISELKDTIFDTKYTLTFPSESGIKTLPTASELNDQYFAGGDGIPATELSGTLVLLKEKADGTETVPVRQMNEGEGMVIILDSNGLFEEAGFQNGRWLIDQTKNQLPLELEAIRVEQTKLAADIVDLQKEDTVLKTTKLETILAPTASASNLIATMSDVSGATSGIKPAQDRADEAFAKAEGAQQDADANSILIGTNANNIGTNEASIKLTDDKIQPLKNEVDANTLGVGDYYDNKANFALISDQDSTKQVSVSGLNWVISGENVTLDTSGLDMSVFTDTEKIEIKTTNSNETVFLTDSYNDASGTLDEIQIGGNDQSVTLMTTTTLWTISGLNGASRNWFVASTPQYIEQKGKTLSGATDITARAGIATNKADIVDVTTTADANTVAIGTSISGLTKQVNDNTTSIGANNNQIDDTNARLLTAEGKINTNESNINLRQLKVDPTITFAGGVVVDAINANHTAIASMSPTIDDTDLAALEAKLGI